MTLILKYYIVIIAIIVMHFEHYHFANYGLNSKLGNSIHFLLLYLKVYLSTLDLRQLQMIDAEYLLLVLRYPNFDINFINNNL